jgi:hypothetical protein
MKKTENEKMPQERMCIYLKSVVCGTSATAQPANGIKKYL